MPSDCGMAEQGDDPFCPSLPPRTLTGKELEQLMEIAQGTGLDGSNSITVLTELLELRAENDRLREALAFLVRTEWKSVGKDNMEFEGRVTCYQLDKARAALED